MMRETEQQPEHPLAFPGIPFESMKMQCSYVQI